MGGFVPLRLSVLSSTAGGAVQGSGSGAATRVAIWLNGTTLTSDSTFTYASNTLTINGVTLEGSASFLNIGGNFQSLNPSASQITWLFGKDVGAGDSTAIAQLSIGNSGTNEGLFRVAFQNAAASGSPSAQLAFDPRNNADSSNFNCTRILMEKTAGANTGSISLQTSISGSLTTTFLADAAGKLTLGAAAGAQFHTVYGRGLDIAYGTAGTTAYVQLVHSSNTANSGAGVYLSVAGSNAGDAFISWDILSVVTASLGLDNSVTGDPITLSRSATLGSSNVFTAAADLILNVPNGIRTKISTANVSSPPTDAELDSAFGTPATVGSGFIGVVDDNGAHTAQYLAVSDGSAWFTYAGTLAV